MFAYDVYVVYFFIKQNFARCLQRIRFISTSQRQLNSLIITLLSIIIVPKLFMIIACYCLLLMILPHPFASYYLISFNAAIKSARLRWTVMRRQKSSQTEFRWNQIERQTMAGLFTERRKQKGIDWLKNSSCGVTFGCFSVL